MKVFFTIAWILLCISSTTILAQSSSWWQHASIYQIAPLSFKDSNNDGKGDIQGIISKLDYFMDTHIDVLLIGPFFESNFVDFGYDVINFTNVDPTFGTIRDVEELFAKAKERGIKIILDFIPNHTSSSHEWFKKSENQEHGFEDFYIWHDGIPQINNGRPLQPNSWRSEYGGFSWKWSETRNAYYYHKFDVHQPDLNLQEELVLRELDKVLLFWLEKGADGFRVDAVSCLIEDPAFLTNPDILIDLQQTYGLIARWSALLKDYASKNGGDERILVPQVWNSPLKSLMKYHEYNAQVPMNFILINELDKMSNANDFKRIIDDYLKALPDDAVANWLVSIRIFYFIMRLKIKCSDFQKLQKKKNFKKHREMEQN
jgi:alpha-glucosidase